MLSGIIFGLCAGINVLVQKPEIPYQEAAATAYYIHGTTASGAKTREGICAGSSLYFGKTIAVWQRLPDGTVGDLIGYYECLDKGGTNGIKSGYVVDIWCESYEDCQEFMNTIYEDGCKGNVYIQVIDAKG